MAGSNYERKLARLLDAQGYHVMRAPSSGGGTSRELPDILFSKPGESIIAGELKTTGGPWAYFDRDEADALQAFAASFGANARLVSRFKQDTAFYLHEIEQARITDGGRLAVDSEMDPASVIEP